MAEQERLLNPCVDAVFKALFTSNSEQSRKALISFVSAAIDRKVSDVKLAPNELPIDTFGERQSSFDIVCMLDDYEPANIEIQTAGSELLFKRRLEYHSAHLLNHYVKKGNVWHDIPKTYQISIVDFIFDSDSDKYVSRYQMRTAGGRKLDERQNIIVIELPKIAKLGIVPPENLTNIEKWGKFLIDADDQSMKDYVSKIAKSEEGIMNATQILQGLNTDYSMWTAQERHDNAIRERELLKRETMRQLEKSLREGHEKGLQEGIREGRTQGLQEGRQEGLKEGLKEGMKEGKKQGLQQGLQQGSHEKAIETAKNLLALGLGTTEQIAQATGLSQSEISKLK